MGAWALARVSCLDTRIDLFPNLLCPLRIGSGMGTSLPSLQAQVELETRADPETFLLFPLPFLSLLLSKVYVIIDPISNDFKDKKNKHTQSGSEKKMSGIYQQGTRF
jgi:hypothetical protein